VRELSAADSDLFCGGGRSKAVMTRKADALLLKQARGTKRTCQNGDCGVRFYDLGRSPIICPICASPYVLASAPIPLAAQPRKPKRPEYPVEEAAPAETAPPDAEVALAEAETEEEDATEEDEPVLVLDVEEEEGGDVSNIIGGPVAEDEKEP
jgi:hypothetical protein